MKQPNYKRTLTASYLGYITQAIVNNLAPLLFLTFQTQFGLGLGQVTALITLNFGVQLVVDAASTLFVDRIGYRTTAVLSHILCTLGLVGLGVLPQVLPNAYVGLVVAIIINAIGGGLIEVIISPIVEALPGDGKAAGMSLLHSFYCWGYVLVVLLSTLFFNLAGIQNWMWLCMLWALLPLFNSVLFAFSPLRPLIEEGEAAMPLRKLLGKRTFLLLFAAMVCAGASEQAMSQWASLFAESGLNVSKTMGDLLGPCVFAVLMGATRLVLGLGKIKLRLETTLLASSVLCMASYLLTVLAPHPVISLLGCGICGLSVGAMWPATFSLAAEIYPRGGTAMFALFALAGDVGCAAGPSLVGFISGAAEKGGVALFGPGADGALKLGILAAIVFPAALLLCINALRKRRAKREGERQPAV